MEREIESAKKVLEANKDAKEATALKAADESLKKALYKVGELMYKQSGGAGADGAPGDGEPGKKAGGGKKDDGVIDAEFTEDAK